MRTLTRFAILLAASSSAQSSYQGILINGKFGGSQLYDPFNTPHAQGNLTLGLQTGGDAYSGSAVIIGPLAYFGAGFAGKPSSTNLTNSCAYVATNCQIIHLESRDGRSFYVYDSALNTTRALAHMPVKEPIEWYGMTVFENDVLVCGGDGFMTGYSQCWLYVPSTDQWTSTVPSLPVARSCFRMVTLHGRRKYSELDAFDSPLCLIFLAYSIAIVK